MKRESDNKCELYFLQKTIKFLEPNFSLFSDESKLNLASTRNMFLRGPKCSKSILVGGMPMAWLMARDF